MIKNGCAVQLLSDKVMEITKEKVNCTARFIIRLPMAGAEPNTKLENLDYSPALLG